MGDYKYPIPITAGRYLTEVGGRSSDLVGGRVGLHIEALRQNTDLSAGDRVLVDPVGRESGEEASPPDPLFVRSTFRVEPIRNLRSSNLLEMSKDGEAVLPPPAPKDLKVGDEIVINSAVDRIPEGWIVKQVHEQMED